MTTEAASMTMPQRAAAWREIAVRAIHRYYAIEGETTQKAMSLAYAAQTYAWLNDWSSPTANSYLSRLYALRNPDGGWGLNAPYDAHGNGTVNPANTTYTVSVAGHVGPVLLDAYMAGRVPRADVQTCMDLLTTCPRIDTSLGRGLAYSRNKNDALPGLLVHNVSAGAGDFLYQCGLRGFPMVWWLIAGIARRTAGSYTLNSGRFTAYRDNMHPTPDDPDHASYTAESMISLAPTVGYYSGYYLMTNDFDHPGTPVLHARLTGAPPVACGESWLELGDRWLEQVDTCVTESWDDSGRLSQVAYYATRAYLRAAAS